MYFGASTLKRSLSVVLGFWCRACLPKRSLVVVNSINFPRNCVILHFESLFHRTPKFHYLTTVIAVSAALGRTDGDDIFELIKFGKPGSAEREIEKTRQVVHLRHPLGWTPLMLAVIQRKLNVVKALLAAGAEVDARENYAGTSGFSFHGRTTSPDVEWRRLTEFSDYLNPSADFRGCTALHYAVLADDVELVRLLLAAGADPTVKNSRGHTPQMYSKSNDINIAIDAAMKQFNLKKQAKDREERQRYPLDQRLREKIVGQEQAIRTVSAAIRRKENGWHDEDHPLVFLFLGSSGIGKTELAKQIAAYLHKGDSNSRTFIRFDMSEFQEKHEVAKFIGAPPGYVGHESGGQLTKALKECSNAVVLFDETEKAHPDVLTALLQVFDEGRLTDGQGNTVDCKNAIFIMTSNVGSQVIAEYAQSLRSTPGDGDNEIEVSRDFKEKVMRPMLRKHFLRDEFLGRINEMVYFLPFSTSELTELVLRNLNVWKEKAKSRHSISLSWDREVIDLIVDGYDVYYGARSITYEIERRIISQLALADERGKLGPNCKVHLKVSHPSALDERKSASSSGEQKACSPDEQPVPPRIVLEVTSEKGKTQIFDLHKTTAELWA
uniref:ANK_REP_REGION domain-containing protein n=1 Tax=Mesocestoides corti TaxID=53468 RepID=A0A5K3EFZ8_MESCO